MVIRETRQTNTSGVGRRAIRPDDRWFASLLSDSLKFGESPGWGDIQEKRTALLREFRKPDQDRDWHRFARPLYESFIYEEIISLGQGKRLPGMDTADDSVRAVMARRIRNFHIVTFDFRLPWDELYKRNMALLHGRDPYRSIDTMRNKGFSMGM